MASKITRIGVAGYKSAMSPVQVNLRDVTVLAGANSAGKSTVIQPLLMIKQTLEKPFDPGGLAIDGPLVKFTSTEQFLSGMRGKKGEAVLKVLIGTDDNAFEVTYRRSIEGLLTPVEMQFERSGKGFTWKVDQEISIDDESLDPSEAKRFGGLFPAKALRIVRTGCWLSPAALISRPRFPREPVPLRSPISDSMHDIQSIIHLPGWRGNPERDYGISGVGRDFPGDFARYVASIIHSWAQRKSQNIDNLGDSLRKLGLTWKVATRRLDDTRVEIRVGRLPAPARGGARDLVSIADVGFGVSQTLPVVVALLAARKGQIVCIEQPEIHLHPRAQTALAELILEAANRGIRVIIETHSSLLLLTIQSLVSEGKLAPERVSLNWFTRDADGQTHVTEAVVAPDGSYGDWQEDFGSVEMALQDRYLDAVDRRQTLERAET